MGIKRIVDTSFWTDGKVDEFSPEDKYFMLYLLTNPFSTQLGIYEISIKQAAFQLGYSMDTVKALIERFENTYSIIFYSKSTNEIAIKNFLRHSIIKGGAPVRDCLIKEIKKVKNRELIAKIFLHIKGDERLNETVKNIIAEYEKTNGILSYSNEKKNDNDNDNDNEVSSPDSCNESFNDSFKNENIIQNIVDLFNSICVSFPSVLVVSNSQESKIQKSLERYGVENIKQCFEIAESTPKLKGRNNIDWTASFDWLIDENNIAKVLNGNFSEKKDEFIEAALARGFEDSVVNGWNEKEQPKTAADDPQIKSRADALKKEFAGK